MYFFYINWITNYMPEAKIIHCRKNPMGNILSMHRSNLTPTNNGTSNIEDAANVLTAQEQTMQIHKRIHPDKIFAFGYDEFVNAPKETLTKLLRWLELDFSQSYLHPEKSTISAISINTACVLQARKPISNKSVGNWKNYKDLLKPAKKFF
ncbi:sulfotransferase [Synechococcus sp. BIOS-E4-1]|uniref:sulfotransferase family protein n=1 Tax=Synechococcus sp. BIOS-E4-1 TaxID=1400864 RepID=UPI0021046000|nr:sulfotransferase [Synechococcus sp. BIOS-E4-1]